jgi:hypothetical protein
MPRRQRARRISSFKEYPREVQNIASGKSIKAFIGGLVTSFEGYTPLHVAILSRNWETAKVIIAIAMAQYEEPTDAGRCNNNSHGELLAGFLPIPHFYLPEEYDEEDDEDSDIELDDDISDELNRKAEIMDISHRFSTIRVPVGPNDLFGVHPHLSLSNGGVSYWAPLAAAVHAADVEATKQILALHELCDPSFPVNPHAELENILTKRLSDNPRPLHTQVRHWSWGF